MTAPADEITHIMPASAGRIKYCQLGMPALAGSVPLMISPSGEIMDRYARVSGLHKAANNVVAVRRNHWKDARVSGPHRYARVSGQCSSDLANLPA